MLYLPSLSFFSELSLRLIRILFANSILSYSLEKFNSFMSVEMPQNAFVVLKKADTETELISISASHSQF